MIRLRWCASLGALVLLGCGSSLRESVDAAVLARQQDAYVRVVLALAARDRDSLDFYAGPAAWRRAAENAFVPLSEVGRQADASLADLGRTRSVSRSAAARRALLAAQLHAVTARVDLLQGRRFSFDDESARLFGVRVGARDASDFDAIRREIDALVPGKGTLPDRFRAFARQFLVPDDRLEPVLARAIDECRRRTIERMPLSRDRGVSVEYVRGMPWSAFTTYLGDGRSLTRINRDFALTVDSALDLACHETYPGHHAIHVQRNVRIQPLFSPDSLRTEGAASFASALAFPLERRIAFEREVLVPLAGLDPREIERYVRAAALVDGLRWLQADIARRYLDGALEFARAAAALEEQALMPPEASEAMLKFVNQFRTYIVTYTIGRDLVRDRVGAQPDEDGRWRAYERWIGT